jgi:CTP-dependent riboflavin kinase
VRIADEDFPKLGAFFENWDCELVPDNPEFCSAGLKKVRIKGIPAALIMQSEDVRIHGKEIVEIVADRHIKDALGLVDGDQVTITDSDFVP